MSTDLSRLRIDRTATAARTRRRPWRIALVLLVLLAGAFGVAWSGVSFVPALVTKNEQATGTLSLLLFPIAFMSTAFVPDAAGDWVRAVMGRTAPAPPPPIMGPMGAIATITVR